MTKDTQNTHDAQLEQWLGQALPGDKPSPRLQEKLHRIPEQFPQPKRQQPYSHSESLQGWLFPALATAASIMGVMAGSLDLLGGMPEQNMLVALLYGFPGLGGTSL